MPSWARSPGYPLQGLSFPTWVVQESQGTLTQVRGSILQKEREDNELALFASWCLVGTSGSPLKAGLLYWVDTCSFCRELTWKPKATTCSYIQGSLESHWYNQWLSPELPSQPSPLWEPACWSPWRFIPGWGPELIGHRPFQLTASQTYAVISISR